MKSLMYFIVGSIVLGSVMGCHPSYTVQQTELMGRKLGVYNDYEIRRWHHHVIPLETPLCLSVGVLDPLDSAQVLGLAKMAFGPAFSQVSVVGAGVSQQNALQQCHGYKGFLVHIDLLSLTEDEHSIDTVGLVVAVVDIEAKKPVDKITVSTQASRFKSMRGGVEDSLLVPLQQVAKALGGGL